MSNVFTGMELPGRRSVISIRCFDASLANQGLLLLVVSIASEFTVVRLVKSEKSVKKWTLEVAMWKKL